MSALCVPCIFKTKWEDHRTCKQEVFLLNVAFAEEIALYLERVHSPCVLTHTVAGFETDDRGEGSPLDSVGYVWSEKDSRQVIIDDVLAICRRLHTFFDMLVFPHPQSVKDTGLCFHNSFGNYALLCLRICCPLARQKDLLSGRITTGL